MSFGKLDEIADQYHLNDSLQDKFIEDLSQYYFCEWVVENFSKSLKCCEMGFGDGITAQGLYKHFDNYIVIEGSSKLVAQAQKKLPSLQVIHGLFEEFRPESQFDLILALHVLEHVDNPLEILQTIDGWLAPGGKVVILVPNKNSLHRIFAKGMGLIPSLDTLSPRDHQVGHQRVYDFEKLESVLIEGGFTVDMKKGFFLKILPNSMMVNFDPKLIVEFNKASTLLSDEYMANICIVATKPSR